jgi:hypothetical protein
VHTSPNPDAVQRRDERVAGTPWDLHIRRAEVLRVHPDDGTVDLRVEDDGGARTAWAPEALLHALFPGNHLSLLLDEAERIVVLTFPDEPAS